MTTVDFRTRLDGAADLLEPDEFLERGVPPLLDERGSQAGVAATRLELVPLTLDVEGHQLTLIPSGDALDVRPGGRDALVVAMDRQGFSDLVQDVTSTFGVQMTGRAEIRRGTVETFIAWEPVLRFLIDGRQVYEPGLVDFHDREGAPLDLSRSFVLDDPPEEIGHFLAEAGFLHLEGVFTEAEMSAVSAELDDAMASAERDDGASWWASTEGGEWYPSRILGFNQKSEALRALLHSQRFATIGTLTDDLYVQRNPDVGDSAEGLMKKVGVVARHL